MRRLVIICLVIAVFVTLIGFNASAQDKIRIGLAAYYSAHDWALDNLRGMRDEAAKQGVELVETMSNEDVLTHAENIESLINSDVDVIISLLGEHEAMRPLASKCADAGIPLIFIDGGLDARGVSLNISSDNVEIGRRIGRWLVEKLGGKGNIIAMIHPTIDCTHAREIGMKEVIADYPEMKILEEHDFDFKGAISTAKSLTEAALLKYGGDNIHAVFGASDGRVIGAAIALDDAGRNDIPVVATDGLSEALNLINTGSSYQLSMLQDAEQMGRTAIIEGIKLAKGIELESNVIYVDPILVDRENVGEIYAELQQARQK
jgi:ribose transport system substrate-binding protein